MISIKAILFEKKHVTAFDGIDNKTGNRVVIKRHACNKAARNEFSILEKTAARCDSSMVVGASLHRLLEDNDLNHGEFDSYFNHDTTDHPSIVVHNFPSGGTTPLDLFEQGTCNDGQLATLIYPLFQAINELHTKTNIVHCDLRPAVASHDKETRSITITELENAKISGEKVGPIGISMYTSPDYIYPGIAHPGMDIWACGIMLYQAAHRGFHRHPLDLVVPGLIESDGEDFIRILTGFEYSPDMWENSSCPFASDLCSLLFSSNITDRLCSQEALNHPLFSAYHTSFQ